MKTGSEKLWTRVSARNAKACSRMGYLLSEAMGSMLVLTLIVAAIVPQLVTLNQQQTRQQLQQKKFFALSGVMEMVVARRNRGEPVEATDWQVLLPDALKDHELELKISSIDQPAGAELISLKWKTDPEMRTLKTLVIPDDLTETEEAAE